jgi:hypothetical protein
MCYHLGVVLFTGMMLQRSLDIPTALLPEGLGADGSGSAARGFFPTENVESAAGHRVFLD